MRRTDPCQPTSPERAMCACPFCETFNYPQLFRLGVVSGRGYAAGGEQALLADVRLRRGLEPWMAGSSGKSTDANFPMSD